MFRQHDPYGTVVKPSEPSITERSSTSERGPEHDTTLAANVQTVVGSATGSSLSSQHPPYHRQHRVTDPYGTVVCQCAECSATLRAASDAGLTNHAQWWHHQPYVYVEGSGYYTSPTTTGYHLSYEEAHSGRSGSTDAGITAHHSDSTDWDSNNGGHHSHVHSEDGEANHTNFAGHTLSATAKPFVPVIVESLQFDGAYASGPYVESLPESGPYRSSAAYSSHPPPYQSKFCAEVVSAAALSNDALTTLQPPPPPYTQAPPSYAVTIAKVPKASAARQVSQESLPIANDPELDSAELQARDERKRAQKIAKRKRQRAARKSRERDRKAAAAGAMAATARQGDEDLYSSGEEGEEEKEEPSGEGSAFLSPVTITNTTVSSGTNHSGISVPSHQPHQVLDWAEPVDTSIPYEQESTIIASPPPAYDTFVQQQPPPPPYNPQILRRPVHHRPGVPSACFLPPALPPDSAIIDAVVDRGWPAQHASFQEQLSSSNSGHSSEPSLSRNNSSFPSFQLSPPKASPTNDAAPPAKQPVKALSALAAAMMGTLEAPKRNSAASSQQQTTIEEERKYPIEPQQSVKPVQPKTVTIPSKKKRRGKNFRLQMEQLNIEKTEMELEVPTEEPTVEESFEFEEEQQEISAVEVSQENLELAEDAAGGEEEEEEAEEPGTPPNTPTTLAKADAKKITADKSQKKKGEDANKPGKTKKSSPPVPQPKKKPQPTAAELAAKKKKKLQEAAAEEEALLEALSKAGSDRKPSSTSPIVRGSDKGFGSLENQMYEITSPLVNWGAGFDERVECLNASIATIQPFLTTADRLAMTVIEHLQRAAALFKNPAARLLLLQESESIINSKSHRIPPKLAALVHLGLSEVNIEVTDFERGKYHAVKAVEFSRACNRDYEEACASNGKATPTCRADEVLMRGLLRIAKCCETMVLPDEARIMYAEAFDIATMLGDKRTVAWIICGYATIMELLANFDAAYALYGRAGELAISLNDRRLAFEVDLDLGVAYLSSGDYNKARPLLERSLPGAFKAKDHSAVSKVLSNLSNCATTKGNMAEAIELLEREFSHATSVGDGLGANAALNLLGVAHRLAGRLQASLDCHWKEYAQALHLPYPARLAECHMHLGTTLRLLKQFSKARAQHRKELELAKRHDDTIQEAKAILNLGLVDLDEKTNIPAAIQNFTAAVSLAECIVEAEKGRYLVKIGCCEVEWKALDGLEAAELALGHNDLAMRFADRKHLPLLTNLLRKASLKPKEVKQAQMAKMGQAATKSAPEMSPMCVASIMPMSIQEAISFLDIDVVIMHSLQWEDTLEYTTFVARKGEKDVHVRTKKMSAEFLGLLAGQDSNFRQMLAGRVHDTPLVPQYLAQTAEVECAKGTVPIEKTQRCSEEKPIGLCEEWLRIFYKELITPISDLLPPVVTECGPGLEDIQEEITDMTAPIICFVPDGLLCNIPFAALRPSDKHPFLIERAAVTVATSIEQLVLQKQRRAETVPCPSIQAERPRYIKHVSSQPATLTCVEDSKVADSFLVKSVVDMDNRDSKELLPPQRKIEEDFVASLVDGISSPVVTVDVPCAYDMREDYSGSFTVSAHPGSLAEGVSIEPSPVQHGLLHEGQVMDAVVGEPAPFLLTGEKMICEFAQQMSQRDFNSSAASNQRNSPLWSVPLPEVTPLVPSASYVPPQPPVQLPLLSTPSACIFMLGATCFTYRVIHETCIHFPHIFTVIDFPRMVGLLWKDQETDDQLQPLYYALASGEWLQYSAGQGSEVLTPARGFRKLLCNAIKQDRERYGMNRHCSAWATLVLKGLPN